MCSEQKADLDASHAALLCTASEAWHLLQGCSSLHWVVTPLALQATVRAYLLQQGCP